MKVKAFTLAELLIALAILGVIATFTIPKVLTASQNNKDTAIAKEAAAMVSGALMNYKIDNSITNEWFDDFTPYMNYVRVDTTSTLDDCPGYGQIQCASGYPCIRLANGAVVRYDQDRIGGNGTNNGLYFMVDPDGKADSANKSIYFLIYANGKLRTWGTMENPTVTDSNVYTPNPALDPSWFSWN